MGVGLSYASLTKAFNNLPPLQSDLGGGAGKAGGFLQGGLGGLAGKARGFLQGGLGGLTGGAGGFLSGASAALGPLGVAFNVGSKIFGAIGGAKAAKAEIKAANAEKTRVNAQMIKNAANVREDLQEVDEEASGQLADMGETIGEKLESSGGLLGQVIKKGRGLSTGAVDIDKENMIENMGHTVDNSLNRLNTERGRGYSGLLGSHMRGVSSNQQQLADLDAQIKDAQGRDSITENLFG